MSTIPPSARLRRAWSVIGAFVRVGVLEVVNHPFAFVTMVVASVVPVVIYLFVARLVDASGPDVGGDYFTFVVVGVLVVRVLDGGLRYFDREIEMTMDQGRLEMLLVEPLSWRALPFGLATWPVLSGLISGAAVLVTGLAAGADIDLVQLPAAFAVMVLGLAAVLAIGILAASVRVISKRSEPVVTFYALGAAVLSGAFFPTDLLPSWLQALSYLVPYTYVVSATRHLLMPGGDGLSGIDVPGALLALVIFNVVAYAIALWTWNRALQYGRRLGTLGGY